MFLCHFTKSVIYFMILLLQLTFVNTKMLPPDVISTSTVLDLMRRLLSYNRGPSDNTVIIDLDNLLHETYIWFEEPVLLYTKDHTANYLYTMHPHIGPIMILIRGNLTELDTALKVHYKALQYSQAIPVLIAILDGSEDDTKEAFRKCYERHILPVVVATWSMDGISWYTYDRGSEQIENRTRNYTLFRNLYGNVTKDASDYRFDICIFEYKPNFMLFDDPTRRGKKITSGIDGHLMSSILKHLNASYQLIVMPNTGTETIESRHNLNRNRCQIAFVTMAIIPNHPGVINTYPLFSEALCIIVPKAEQKSKNLNLIRPFTLDTWEALAISMLVLLLTWLIFFYLSAKNTSNEEKFLNVLDFYGILINISLHIRFHRLVSSSRFFIFAIVMYSFYVTHWYVALLEACLLKPSYYGDINTLDEVAESGLQILGLASMINEWKHSEESKEYSEAIRHAIIGKPDYEDISTRFAKNDISIGFIIRERLLRLFLSSKLHNPHGEPVYHMVPECIHPTFFTYVVRYDFPYLKRIEQMIRTMQEAGLSAHWDMKSKHKYFEQSEEKSTEPAEHEEAIALTMIHLMGIFYCFLMGCTLSVIVFILELAIAQLKILSDSTNIPPYQFIA